MLPDSMRARLAERVASHFQCDHENLRKSALRLQDAGFGDDGVLEILKEVWPAAYSQGYRDGFDAAIKE